MDKPWWQAALSRGVDRLADRLVTVVVTGLLAVVAGLTYMIWTYIEQLPTSYITLLAGNAAMLVLVASYYATILRDKCEERKKQQFRLTFEFDPTQHISDTRDGKKAHVIVRNVGKTSVAAISVKIDAMKPLSGTSGEPRPPASEAIGCSLCQAEHDAPTHSYQSSLPQQFALASGESKLISVVHLCKNRQSWLLVTNGQIIPNSRGRFARTPRAELGSGMYALKLLAVSQEAYCTAEFRLTTAPKLTFDWLSPPT